MCLLLHCKHGDRGPGIRRKQLSEEIGCPIPEALEERDEQRWPQVFKIQEGNCLNCVTDLKSKAKLPQK